MSRVLARLAGPAGAVVDLPLRRHLAGGAVVLGYHDVLPTGPGGRGALGTWDVDGALLEAHVRVIRRVGYRIAPLAEVVDAAIRRDAGALAGLAALTFDDALVGVSEVALPLLERLACPFTVFATTAEPGRQPSWWPGARRTLDVGELRELAAHPLADVQAHTRSHRSLPELDAGALAGEVAGGRAELAAQLGRPVDDVSVLAYPFGHAGEREEAAAEAAGFRAACTFTNGRVTAAASPFALPRLTPGRHLSPARLAYHLARRPGSWPPRDPAAATGDGPRIGG